MAGAIKVNRTLTSIDLGNNAIKYEGAEALIDAMGASKSLSMLKIDENNLQVEKLQAHSKAHPQIEFIDSSKNI